MRTPSLLLSLCLLLSCGAPMPGEEGERGATGAQGSAGRDGKDAVQGGSRLRPLTWVGSDGTRVATFVFWDNERRERCYLQAVPGAAPDSLERLCAPMGFAAADASRYVRFSLE